MTGSTLESGYVSRFFSAQDGLRLHYRDYGEATAQHPALLCLPGLARNAKDFHVPALRHAGKRRVIASDYRGRGRSEWDPDWRNYQPRTYLDDIRHLLAGAGLQRMVVLGTSLGGALAMALGVLQPSLLAGVILNDIGTEVGSAGIARVLAYLAKDRPQPDWPSAAAHLKSLLPNLSIDSEDGWLRFAGATYREGDDGLLHFDWDPTIVRPLLTGRQSPVDLWPLFGSLGRLPVLLIRGGKSDILSDATASRMADAHPGMGMVTVPGAGHAPTLEEPAVVEAIDAFLSEI
ncbi:MAG: alpha/beta hydrolase [Proteobacteria bacterium]|nr:alpha/beta hydrolase [Pseudomonadota bacterium]MBI3497480.1 alpha/beta hydrolase [Pseudomonadota bacterium]